MRDERERDKRAVVAGAGAPPNAYLYLLKTRLRTERARASEGCSWVIEVEGLSYGCKALSFLVLMPLRCRRDDDVN